MSLRALLILVTLISACGKEAVTPTAAPGISIQVATWGEDVDADGYKLVIDRDSIAVSPNQSLVIPSLSPGPHTIALTGVARNCTALAPVRNVVVESSVVAVSFNVACVRATGTLTIRTVTSGLSQDPDGYALDISFQGTRSIGLSETLVLSGIQPGAVTVRLGGVADNCSVIGTGEKVASVVRDTTTAIDFAIQCAQKTGTLVISVSTTGVDLDPDDYVFSLGSLPWEKIRVNESITLSSVPAGYSWLEIGGFAQNCLADESTSQYVDVPYKGTKTVAFHVRCTAVSSASRRIAFVSTRNPLPGTGIYSVLSNGQDLRPLAVAQEGGTAPEWSPDGNRIAYVCGFGPSEVCVMDADGTNKVRLTLLHMTISRVSWSPDGAKLVFDGIGAQLSSGIYIMNADGTDLTTVISNNGRSPSFSRDGKRILFVGSNLQLFTMALDGSDQRQLTTGNFALEPTYSPDGSHILFIRYNLGSRINEMNADGTGVRVVFGPTNVSWARYAPDNSGFVFAATTPGGSDIFTARLDGSNVTAVTSNGRNNNTQPVYRP